MIMKINFRLAVNSMLTISALALMFQFLVLMQVLPYDIVWGGRLNSLSQMHTFVGISVVINVFILLVIAMKGAYLQMLLPKKLVNGILWGLVLLFSLNTVGNALSLSTFEALTFTPITLIAALCCYRVVVEPL